ncbi:MAG TPA: response regulator [Solirubrobacterales bacterium]|nr:response regulator [Solirubrobacterales bacterium]
MATVLIADDSMFMRKRLGDILTGEGHDVVAEAEDGDEAIMLFRQFQPELVMLDITMPERNGLGALNHIMSLSPEAKVVMCSALGEESVVNECIETGAKAFVVKPFDPEQVLEAVGTALGGE